MQLIVTMSAGIAAKCSNTVMNLVYSVGGRLTGSEECFLLNIRMGRKPIYILYPEKALLKLFTTVVNNM
jgi:hypothetical protein